METTTTPETNAMHATALLLFAFPYEQGLIQSLDIKAKPHHPLHARVNIVLLYRDLMDEPAQKSMKKALENAAKSLLEKAKREGKDSDHRKRVLDALDKVKLVDKGWYRRPNPNGDPAKQTNPNAASVPKRKPS